MYTPQLLGTISDKKTNSRFFSFLFFFGDVRGHPVGSGILSLGKFGVINPIKFSNQVPFSEEVFKRKTMD